MTKEEKYAFVEELAAKIKENPFFYVIDMGGFTVAKTNDFRRAAFAANLEVQVAKNTLIKKAMERSEVDYTELYPALKETSALVFFKDNFKAPAELVKKFRDAGSDKLTLKAAYVEETAFVGEGTLDTLIKLKTKNELLGEIIGTLQSPMKNVLGALKGQGGKIAGILKTLEERKS